MRYLLIPALLTFGVAAMLAGCKDDKPETRTVQKSAWQVECESRGGKVVRVPDTRQRTCQLPEEKVEIDTTDPWFDKPPADKATNPVADENGTVYVSPWDEEHVKKLDSKDIKINDVQAARIEEQRIADVNKYGLKIQEVYAHAPDKKFKDFCASKSGTFSKIHGGKWVCRFKE